MATDRKKKESIFELSKFLDKTVRVKFQGGREATGVLKGYDALLNIVLDNTTEYLREFLTSHSLQVTYNRSALQVILERSLHSLDVIDPDDPFKLTDETRQLGLAVCRGTAVVLVCPVDGMEPIANPFLQQE